MTEFSCFFHTIIDDETGEEDTLHFVIPGKPDAETVTRAFDGDDGYDFDYICECRSEKDAILIAMLLAKHYSLH